MPCRVSPSKSQVMRSSTASVPSGSSCRKTSKSRMRSARAGSASAIAASASQRTAVPRMASGPEPDLRDAALGIAAELEVVAASDAEAARDEVPRERLDGGVQVTNDRVVVAACVLDRLLEPCELALQLEKVLVRAQLGVAFGDGEEALEGGRERRLGLRLVGRCRRLHREAAGAGHLLERHALVRGIALHGLDEVRAELPSPLELHVDVTPGRLRAVSQPDEAVV